MRSLLKLIILIAGLPTLAFAQTPGTITTIAGGGLDDVDNVSATDASLENPLGIALDAQGNLYIADTAHHRIRRVDATTGTITTIAGLGEPGFSGDGGPATLALINRPNSITVDSAGNVYISSGGTTEGDFRNRRVRRIAPSGIITTVAGTGEGGFNDNVPALQATFHEIVALTMFGNAAVLISDGIDQNGQGNNRMRQLDLTRDTINTIAGSGSATAATIQDGGPANRAGLTPEQLYVTSDGSVYIADLSNGRIRRVNQVTQDSITSTVINTVAGRAATFAEELQLDLFKGDGGSALQALFFAPSGVAVDASGNIYIGDTGNHRLRVVEAETGNVLTIAGTGIPDAGAESALGLLSDLNQPTRLLIDANGDLIFIDTANNRIRKLHDPTFRMPLFNAITTNIDFNRVSIGDPNTRTFLVENRGNLPLNIETVVSDNPAFQVSSELPITVGIAQTVEIEIIFSPQQEGLTEGLITITTDDPRTPSTTFNVQGQGEAPAIGIFPTDILAFDQTFIGQSHSLSVRISNLGAGVLVVPQATTNDSQFVVLTTDTIRVPSGLSQQLTIAFSPRAEDLQQATLTIFSNDPLNPAVILQLEGMGLSAKPGGFVDIASNTGLGDTGAGFGASWADIDNDNDPDLYLVRSTEPNRLFRNDGTSFSDIAGNLGIDDSGDGSAGIWGDIDRDGDLDLYVTNFGTANRLFRNDGSTFSEIATSLGIDDSGDGYGAGWADYDRDGDLDLYVTNFGANRFYQNEGTHFVERADSLGLNDTESGIQPAWGDYDNDGDPDLFLANSGPNRLFRNDGDTFTSTENLFNPTDAGPSFGAAWGDYDNDGFLDLIVPYFGASNRLYSNLKNGGFKDLALSLGIAGNERSRGAAWGDFDNDGFLDLYITNSGQPNLYYKNVDRGGRAFEELADSLGVAHNADSRGLALADYNNDGGLDLYVAIQNSPDILYNNREANGNWVAIRPLGTDSSIDAIGLRLEISYANNQAIREITGGASFLSQDASAVVFGVGDAQQIDVLTLRWPGGIVQQLRSDTEDLSVNQIIDITEQRPLPPARILLTSQANNLLANGIAETDISAQIVTVENRLVLVSDRVVHFRVESGQGIIIGGDSITVRDGVATARYRSGSTTGTVTILAESDGIESARVEIELIKPFAEDALTIRTIAGSGAEAPFGGGFEGDGGPATEALIRFPEAVLADTLGNVYIADTQNQRIRRVDIETATIQTVVGTGVAGLGNQSSDTPALSANISTPQGLAFAKDGALVLSETGSNVIRIVRNDTLRSLVGTGVSQFGGDNNPSTNANISSPIGIAINNEGILYLADNRNQRIRKVDANGIITTVVGGGNPDVGDFRGDGGPATQARLNRPSAIAIDAQNNLYIADTQNHRIRKVDANGIITTVAGSGTDGFSGDGGPATLAEINSPQGVAVDNRGHLFISDTGNDRVRILDLNSGLIQTVAGTGLRQLDLEEGGALAVSLNSPRGLAIGPTGTVLIADRANHRIRELTVQFDLATLFAPQEKSIDFNNDGQLDFNDFLLFIRAFDSADTRFDLDNDGLVGFADFLRFVNAFEKGLITIRP